MATGTVYVDDTFVTTDINTGKVTIASTFQNQGLKIQSAGVEWTITEFNENTPIASSLVKLSLNPDIAGIGIHALNDGNWVLGAGLIDNFRNPKSPITQLRKCSLIVTLLFAQAIKMSTLEGQYKSCLHLSTMETYCQEHFYFV